MNEEFVTDNLIDYLRERGWDILSFDYPESGTGVVLHLNSKENHSKNQNSIIPDIIANKEEKLLVMENKTYYSRKDLDKLNKVKDGGLEDSLKRNFPKTNWETVITGVGCPKSMDDLERLKDSNLDYVAEVDQEGNSEIEKIN